MTDLQVFEQAGSGYGPLHVIEINGEPWFVAADVTRVLGYAHVGSALRGLKSTEKDVRRMHTHGGEQDISIISEPGFYRLVMRSNRPEADAFQTWVTSEVLPSIRKTGSYGTPALPTSPRELAMMVIAEADRADKATAELEEARPAIEAHARYLDATGTMSMATAAQMLGVGQNTLFRELREHRVLIGSAGVRLNTPYQPYIAPRGWFVVKAGTRLRSSGEEEATYTTRVTPKGLEGIRKLLAG